MAHYPTSLLRLVKQISQLPGIGEKTAERLALHILKTPVAEAEALSASILEIKKKIQLCEKCFSWSDEKHCTICQDANRDKSLLCVVEQPADMASIERSGAFKGVYHVLSGVLSPINGVGPDDIRLRELLNRLQNENIKEIILALGTNVEGEATASYLHQLFQKFPVIIISRIASGVPIGGDLKYIDQVTLKQAMEHRRKI